jgi:uncharacterized repeat protein (TIGR03847 family)
MAKFTYDLDPVTRITANAVGEPGRRVFWLQARRGRELVSLIAEKEQIRALAEAIDRVIEDVTTQDPLLSASDDLLLASDMSLEMPLDARFRIAQMGIGYDSERDMIVLILQGARDADGQTPTARFAATRQQMRALSEHAAAVISRGRRICGNCGRPIDAAGHFCPQRN